MDTGHGEAMHVTEADKKRDRESVEELTSVMTYTVHEPPVPEADRVDRGTGLEFVKDGFSWVTAVCPPLGFLANGLWLPALAYVVLASIAGWALNAAKVDPAGIGLLFAIADIYLGLELSSIRRWDLDRKGWTTLGVVNGKSIADCERRFFEGWLPGQPILASAAPQQPASASVPQVPRSSRLWPFGSGA